MKVKKYVKTGNMHPASWLAVLEDGNDNLRISYRNGQLEVVRGQTPLENSENSEVLVDEQVETKGSRGTLRDSRMVTILGEYGVEISLDDKVSRTDEDIRRVEQSMEEHLGDLADTIDDYWQKTRNDG